MVFVPGHEQQVQETATPAIFTVLAPTDLSPAGNRAVPYAYAMLSSHGGVVELCHVHERILAAPAYAYERTEGKLTDAERARIEGALRALIPGDAKQRGITTHVTVIDGGRAGDAIVQAVRAAGRRRRRPGLARQGWRAQIAPGLGLAWRRGEQPAAGPHHSEPPPMTPRASGAEDATALSALLKETADSLGVLIADHVKLARVELETDVRIYAGALGVSLAAGALLLFGYAFACAALALALGKALGGAGRLCSGGGGSSARRRPQPRRRLAEGAADEGDAGVDRRSAPERSRAGASRRIR